MNKDCINANAKSRLLIISILLLSIAHTASAQTMTPNPVGQPIYQSAPAQSLGSVRQSEIDSSNNFVQAPAGQAAGSGNIDDAMQPVQVGNVTYITGGVGDEERAELQQVKGDYNLHIMSASHDGAFVGDTHLTVRSKSGEVIFEADAGPLFFAKLPSGVYTIEATHNGSTKKQTVSLKGSKAAHIHLGW